jgi:predicted nucleic acid-binding Zn ribbon protein
VLIVTLPEATPVHEAAALQDDLRRAQIEPFAWVINQSFAESGSRDPLLVARGADELPLHSRSRREVLQAHRHRALGAEEPVGPEKLRQFFKPHQLNNRKMTMTTYVYETIPRRPARRPRYFEIKQSMNDAPLTKHPETGERFAACVLGGFGVLSSGKPGGSAQSAAVRAAGRVAAVAGIRTPVRSNSRTDRPSPFTPHDEPFTFLTQDTERPPPQTSHEAILTCPQTAEFFERYLSLWVFVCMVVGVASANCARRHHRAERAGVRQGFARQRAHRGAHLADDLPDDAQDRFRRHQGRVRQTEGAVHHAVRELAGETVQHGAAGYGCSCSIYSGSLGGSTPRPRNNTRPG